MFRIFSFVILALSVHAQTAQFPATIATDANLLVAKDSIQTVLTSAMTNVATSATVQSTTGWVANMVASVESEQMLVTAVPDSTHLTVTRPFGGTSAVAHSSGKSVNNYVDAYYHNALKEEVKAIETSLGINFSLPFLRSQAYDFAAQTPGGSLVALGVGQTITLTPCPLGVAGTNAGHYLYFSGGTGTAEATPITGGTCTSNAASGTITVTPTNAHSGAWTIRSASGGIQEAIMVSGGYGTVWVTNTTASPATIYGPVSAWPSGGNLTIRGNGSGANTIFRASTFTAGDMFLLDNTSGIKTFPYVTFEAIGIEQGSFTQTGAAIRGISVAYVGLKLLNTTVSNGQYGVRVKGTSLFTQNLDVYNAAPAGYKPLAGIFIEGTGTAPETTNVFLYNTLVVGYPRADANELTYGLYVTGADGINSSGLTLSADYALVISPGASDYVVNSNFNGVYIDGPTFMGIQSTGSGLISRVHINQYYVNGPLSSAAGSVGVSLGGAIQTARMTQGSLYQSQLSGMVIGSTAAALDIEISDTQFLDNDLSNTASNPHLYIFDGQAGVRAVNNRFHNTAAGKNTYGIQIAGNLSNSIIANNSCSLTTGVAGALCILYDPAKAPTVTTITNNNGTVTNAPAVASAGTVTLPTAVHDFYTVTGTTTIATINGGWIGRELTLQFTNASPGGLSAAGNVYVAKSVVQNGVARIRWDGTKWMVLN